MSSFARLGPALGLVGLCLAQPLAAEETALLALPGDRVALDYEAYKGGFRVMDIGIGLDLSEAQRYRVDLDGKLVGAPALLFSYQIGLDAEGRMSAEGPIPEHFRLESKSGKKKEVEWLELTFDERGLATVSGNPDPSEEPRPPVTEGWRLGAIDLLSGLVEVVQKTLVSQDCNVKASVFDGRRRFDVVFADQGLRELPKSSINLFSGQARLCQITVKPLTGYRYDGRDKKALPEEIEAYLASPAPGLPEMPVRLIVHTGWGSVLVHLVGVREGKSG